MVWFQCEDCGEDLKKPKLPNHFRICSASKFSCIDCGLTFGQQSVQGHTQCITEAEKYGPKGQGKASNGPTPKPNKDSKPKADVDINVGLSDRPPWFCSLCNTNATSKQTLLLHAEGKKHRAKARAFHVAKQPPKQTEEAAPESKIPSGDTGNDESIVNENAKQPKLQDPPKADAEHNNSKADTGTPPSKKKRKLDASVNDISRKKTKDDNSGELGNGEVIHGKKAEAEETTTRLKLAESSSIKEDTGKIIKWKKLITSALKLYMLRCVVYLALGSSLLMEF